MSEAPQQPCRTIQFNVHADNGALVEMMRIEPDGFYVRGVKVTQGEREAQQVYEGFRAWLYKIGIIK